MSFQSQFYLFFFTLGAILCVFLYNFFNIDINEKATVNTALTQVTDNTIVLSSELDLTTQDTDNDGLSSFDEMEIYRTDPNSKDSDKDKYNDKVEVENDCDPLSNTFIDTDSDGLFDQEEIYLYRTDPNRLDTDGDGYSDYNEIQNGYSPLVNSNLHVNKQAVIQNEGSTKIPILTYHKIVDIDKEQDNYSWNLSIAVETFREQMKFLKNNEYEILHLKDLKYRKGGEKSIILLFNDGYKNFYENAFPIIKEYGLSASISIITSKVDDTEYLDREQIKELSSAGIEIISHTINHPILTELTDEQIRYELAESKRLLENLLGDTVDGFVYPIGKYNNQIKTVLESLNYNYAVTTNYGLLDLTESSFLQLPIIRIDNRDTINSFIWKVRDSKL